MDFLPLEGYYVTPRQCLFVSKPLTFYFLPVFSLWMSIC